MTYQTHFNADEINPITTQLTRLGVDFTTGHTEDGMGTYVATLSREEDDLDLFVVKEQREQGFEYAVLEREEVVVKGYSVQPVLDCLTAMDRR